MDVRALTSELLGQHTRVPLRPVTPGVGPDRIRPDTRAKRAWDACADTTRIHATDLPKVIEQWVAIRRLLEVGLTEDDRLRDDDLPPESFVRMMRLSCSEMLLPATMHLNTVKDSTEMFTPADCIAYAFAATMRWKLEDEDEDGDDDEDEDIAKPIVNVAGMQRGCTKDLDYHKMPDFVARRREVKQAFCSFVYRAINRVVESGGSVQQALHSSLSAKIRWTGALLHLSELYTVQPNPVGCPPAASLREMENALLKYAHEHPVDSNCLIDMFHAVTMCFLPVGVDNEYFKYNPAARSIATATQFVRAAGLSEADAQYVFAQSRIDPSKTDPATTRLDARTKEVWILFSICYALSQKMGEIEFLRSRYVVGWWQYSDPVRMRWLALPYECENRPILWNTGLRRWVVVQGKHLVVCNGVVHALATWLYFAHTTKIIPDFALPVFGRVGAIGAAPE